MRPTATTAAGTRGSSSRDSACFGSARAAASSRFPSLACPTRRVEDQYLRGALPLVLQMRGHQVLHASAVGTPSGILALSGASGAGKSTLAHALSRLGHSPWADDALVFAVSDAGVQALPVPFAARLSSEARRAFPADIPNGGVPSAPDHRAHTLCAVVVLEPAEDDAAPLVRIDRLAPTEAFTALLPHAYAYRASDIERNRDLTTAYLGLVKSVPVYNVRLRRSLADLPAAVDELEARLLRTMKRPESRSLRTFSHPPGISGSRSRRSAGWRACRS